MNYFNGRLIFINSTNDRPEIQLKKSEDSMLKGAWSQFLANSIFLV